MITPTPIFRHPRHSKLAFSLLLFVVSMYTARAQTGANSATVGTDLQRAEAALKANDQASAARLFQVVLDRDPGNAEAHANLGAFAFFRGDCGSAEQNFRVALERSPDLTKIQALLSICEQRRGEPSAAADMESAFSKLKDPQLSLQLGMELANAYYQQGNFPKTATTLQALLVSQPDNVDLLFFAQRVYSELADSALSKLAVLSPNSARMEQLVAERLINAGDVNDAAAHYRKALQLGPKLPGLHYELAETLLEGSPYTPDVQKEAVTELTSAKEIDGDSARIEVQFGRLAALQANQQEALLHYQRAFELDPTDAKAQMGLAEIYRQQDKPEEAAKYLRLAVKSDPFSSEPHYKLSQVDRQLHLNEESKRELQLFEDLRATQNRVKLLYREMNPQTAKADSAATPR